MILVDHGSHDGSDVEGLLAPGVGCVVEHFADRRELRSAMGVAAHVPGRRVGGAGAAREALPGRDVGMVVVPQQDLARGGHVRRPVLGLAVGSHHPFVAPDALVVLGRHTARVVQRLLAGEDHRRLRCHDQDPPGVHEHGGFCVPVRLGAHIDAGDDDIDLSAGLGE